MSIGLMPVTNQKIPGLGGARSHERSRMLNKYMTKHSKTRRNFARSDGEHTNSGEKCVSP
jgi:hypothetical protein